MAMYHLAMEHIWLDKARYDNSEKNYHQQLIIEQSSFSLLEKISENAQYDKDDTNYGQQSKIEQAPAFEDIFEKVQYAEENCRQSKIEQSVISSENVVKERQYDDTDKKNCRQLSKVQQAPLVKEQIAKGSNVTPRQDSYEKETIKNSTTYFKACGYKGKKKCYGEYSCLNCFRWWGSFNSRSGVAQKCQKCNHKVLAHRQLKLENVLVGEKFQNKSNAKFKLCPVCTKLGYSIHKVNNKFDGFIWNSSRNSSL